MRAIWSPETGIVDWVEVARHYARVFTDNGGTVLTDFEAVKFTGDHSEASIHGQSEASTNIDQSQSRSRRLWV